MRLSIQYDETLVIERLRVAARKVVPSMLAHKMRGFVNSTLVSSVNLGFSPATLTIARDLHAAAERSLDRIKDRFANDLSESKLVELEQEFRNEIEASFSAGTWLANLPGREMLKQFVDCEKIPVAFELFRNLIVSRMVEVGHKPEGMKKIFDKIRAD